MNLKRFRITSRLVGAILVAGGTLIAAPASTQSGKSMMESGEAARLLRRITWDAGAARTHAQRWERLANTSSAAWQSYDRQWNEIKPAVEGMNVRLKELEAIRAKLSPAQQQAIASIRPLLQVAEGHTHRLRALLNRNVAAPSSPASRRQSAALARDARQIAITARQAGASGKTSG